LKDAHRRCRALVLHRVRLVGASRRARGRCSFTNFLDLEAYLRLLVLLVRGVPHAGLPCTADPVTYLRTWIVNPVGTVSLT
jgi:hypothetical protein